MYYLFEDKKNVLRIIDKFEDINHISKYIINMDDVIRVNAGCKTSDDVINKLKEGIDLVDGILSFGDDTILIDSNHIKSDSLDLIRSASYDSYRNKIRKLMLDELLQDEER